jgi:hypothetical protein
MHVLTPHEVGCCFCRIGWLKLYNPMKPEGSYVLSIGRFWEEKVYMYIDMYVNECI